LTAALREQLAQADRDIPLYCAGGAKRYDTDMDLREIQHAIETLSNEQQIALLGWLAERDRRQWDSQIERDFSPDGAGVELLNQVKAQIRRGEPVRMGDGQTDLLPRLA
jgi:hypothetical protein